MALHSQLVTELKTEPKSYDLAPNHFTLPHTINQPEMLRKLSKSDIYDSVPLCITYVCHVTLSKAPPYPRGAVSVTQA